MKVLITVLDAITETSMPFNEFVLYRANHIEEEKQILIVCDCKKKLPEVIIPDSITIERVGWSIINLRKVLKKYIKEYADNNIPLAIHMHQNKSAVLAHIAMFGTGFRHKVLFTTHNTFSGFPLHNKVQSFFCGLLSNYVVCCSNSAFEGYPTILKKIKGSHVSAIQNGVDTERIDSLLMPKERSERNRVQFVYVARMVPVKNHKFLLDVIEKCDPDAHFVFIGATDKHILAKIKDRRLEKQIDCLGLIPRNKVFEILQQSDVYISPSVLEGLPVSVLEGMYAGLPAILSNIPQHAEVCLNNSFIRLLSLDLTQWVKAINETVLQKEKLSIMGENSRKYIKDNFSLERMHDNYSKIYNILRELC